MEINRRDVLTGLGGITAASTTGVTAGLPADAHPQRGPRTPASGQPDPASNHLLTVKDYGARGDGSGDDHPAFQAMADDRRWPDDRHWIVIPPGDYRISQPIVAKHPLTVTGLAGDGSNWGQSSVRLKATATMDALIIPQGWQANTGNGPQITTSNLQLDGGEKAKHGIILNASGEVHFNTRVTSTTSHGWLLPQYCRDGSTEVNPTHGCRFVYCGSGRTGGHGFFAMKNRMDSQLIGFVAVHVGGHWGINIQQGTGWLVDGCHPSQYQKGGIFVDHVWQTRIVNNYVDTLGAAEDFTGTCIGIWARGYGPVNIANNVVNQLPDKAPTQSTVGYRIGGAPDDGVVKINMANNAGLHHPGSDWTFIDDGNQKFSLTSAIAHNMDATTGSTASAGIDDVRQGRTRRGHEQVRIGDNGHFQIDHHLGVEPAYADVKPDAEHADLVAHVSRTETNATHIDATVRSSDGKKVDARDIHVYWIATS